MADISTIEQMVLEQVEEDLTTPDNWDGTTEVRDAVNDGFDELCAYGRFFSRLLTIPMKAVVSVYRMTPLYETVVGVKSVRLREYDRRLEQVDFQKLCRTDPRWLSSRGSPYLYVLLDFEKILVYPCYSGGEGALEIDAILIPEPYTGSGGPYHAHRDFELALVDYAMSELYVRFGGNTREAAEAYSRFLQRAGAGARIKGHLEAFQMRVLKDGHGS